MKIGIVQRDDTRNVLSSSGTIYSMSASLERHVGQVVHLGPDTSWTGKALIKGGSVLNRIVDPLFNRRLSPIHQLQLARHAARLFAGRIERAQCDVLFAPFASVEIAALSTPVPIVYHTDMTWAQGVDYYSIYTNLFQFAQDAGEQIQRAALQKAALSIFPSAWTAESATAHYGITPEKVHVVSYGANFADADVPSAEKALQHTLDGGVTLLWIGVDWERKGGPTAYECLRALLEHGVEARLVICGCTPPKIFQDEHVSIVPFLNKNIPEQRATLSQLFLDANFFLFPTLKEAAAIVLCEAGAHGLPSIARDTGGLSSVIIDGENGCLLPEEANGREFADKIRKILADDAFYTRLVRGSRQAYEDRLNWNQWGKSVKPLFESLTAPARP